MGAEGETERNYFIIFSEAPTCQRVVQVHLGLHNYLLTLRICKWVFEYPKLQMILNKIHDIY